jgi:putative resolvase
MSKFVPSRKAAETLGLHPNTLRRLADSGKIEFIKTPSGQRHYNTGSFIGN